MSESNAGRDPIEMLADSFLARFRRGERPSVEDYAAQHPELADEIRELLPALVMLEQEKPAAGAAAGTDGPHPPGNSSAPGLGVRAGGVVALFAEHRKKSHKARAGVRASAKHFSFRFTSSSA
jgi:hypothetical protein